MLSRYNDNNNDDLTAKQASNKIQLQRNTVKWLRLHKIIGILRGIKFTEKISFRSPLKCRLSVLLTVRTCSGRSFHALGAATLKARSPNFSQILGTCRSDLVADRKTMELPHCRHYWRATAMLYASLARLSSVRPFVCR